jgi:Putative peptidoglycan-binding domain-containing protein
MDIKSIQRKLNDLGYDAGTADGIKGEKTITAIKKFQSDYALDSDGIVGSKTKQSLDAISLMGVQRKLKGLGYTCDVNGTRDDSTVKAIKDFQQQKGLEANGIINQQTKDALAL